MKLIRSFMPLIGLLALLCLAFPAPSNGEDEDPGLRVNLPLGHHERVTGAAFLTPRLVATCSKDATVIVWDVDTGCPLHRFFMPDTCFGMTLLASGKLQVDCGTHRRGEQRATLDPKTSEIEVEDAGVPFIESAVPPDITALLSLPVTATTAARQDTRILVGHENGHAELWTTETEEPVVLQRFQSEICRTTAVAASGDWLASWSFMVDRQAHNLRFWNTSALRIVTADAKNSTNIVSGCFMEDGKHFVSCENSRFDWRWNLVVRETRSGRIVSTAQTDKGQPSILSTTPGDTRIVQTQYGLTGPGVCIWEFQNGELRKSLTLPEVEANWAVLDSKRQRIYSQGFLIAEEGIASSHDAASGRNAGTIGKGVQDIFGTVVGMRIVPADDLLLTSTFHRALGYCAVTDLNRNTSQITEFDGIHSAFVRAGGRQLLLGATEGTIRVSLLDRTAKAALAHWEYPQSNYFREHLSAAYGWTAKKDAVALSDDEGTVYVVEPTGAIHVLKITAGNEFEDAALLVPLSNGDWSIVAADGSYASSPGGAAKMAFSRDERTFPFEQFDLVFNRPDIIVEALGAPEEKVADFRKAIEERRMKYAAKSDEETTPPNFDPTVSIQNRETIGPSTATPSLGLEISLGRFPPGESTLIITTNGVEQVRLSIPEGASSMNADVPLARGVNRIEATALFSDGTGTLPDTFRVYHHSETPPNLFLLAVGVSDYATEGLDLAMASKDAKDVTRFLEEQEGKAFGKVQTKLLLDAEATKENILDAAEFFAGAEAGDTVVIFLAGHGMLEAGTFEYHFGTPDIDPENVNERGIPYSDLEKIFARCKSSSRLILMDTCFAGEVETFDLAEPGKTEERVKDGVSVRAVALASPPSRKSGSMARLRRELFSDLRRSSGANVITASGGMEFVFAGENEEVGNGLFTHCLLQGVGSGDGDTNGDGRITVTELSDYLRTSLDELSGGAQQPTVREVNRHSDFGIARCRAFPKLDAGQLLGKMIDLTEVNDVEEEYAALFAPECDYFGSLMTRAEIAAGERAYHEKYDARDVSLIAKPELTDLGEGAYSVDYRIQITLLDSESGGYTGVAIYDSPYLIEQHLRMRVRFESPDWQITKIEVVSSEKLPNPHLKKEG